MVAVTLALGGKLATGVTRYTSDWPFGQISKMSLKSLIFYDQQAGYRRHHPKRPPSATPTLPLVVEI